MLTVLVAALLRASPSRTRYGSRQASAESAAEAISRRASADAHDHRMLWQGVSCISSLATSAKQTSERACNLNVIVLAKACRSLEHTLHCTSHLAASRQCMYLNICLGLTYAFQKSLVLNQFGSFCGGWAAASRLLWPSLHMCGRRTSSQDPEPWLAGSHALSPGGFAPASKPLTADAIANDCSARSQDHPSDPRTVRMLIKQATWKPTISDHHSNHEEHRFWQRRAGGDCITNVQTAFQIRFAQGICSTDQLSEVQPVSLYTHNQAFDGWFLFVNACACMQKL